MSKRMPEPDNSRRSAILYVPPSASEIEMLSANRARPVPRLVTDRTVLTLLDSSNAHLSQAYYVRNREHLAPWEPLRSDDFFSLPAACERAQTARAQYQLGQSVLFCALDHPEQEMLASCHLSSIQYGCSMCCNLGFSVSADYQGTGLMYEVASEVIRHAFEHLGLHRVTAGHMPDNHRSGALLKRLGFEKVGYARSQIRIAGRWEDHVQLAMINPAEDVR